MRTWGVCLWLMTGAFAAQADTDLALVQQQVQEGHALVEVKANTKANLKRAVELLERHSKDARLSKQERLLAYNELARARLRLGDLTQGKEKRIAQYTKGREASQQAQKIDPNNADAVFWEAANAGCIGREKGIFNAAAGVPALKEKFEFALKLDPNHHYARDALAQVYYRVPGFMGGSDEKSEQMFREVLRRDPDFTPAKVHFATFLIEEDREDEAKVLLQQVRDAKRSSVPHDWRKFNRPNAIAALKKLEE